MRYFIALAVLSGLTITSTAAQSGSPSIFYVNTGLGIPFSPEAFSDRWNTGFNVGAGYGVALSPVVTVQGYITYHQFGFNSGRFLRDLDLSDTDVRIDGVTATVITVMGNVKLASSLPEESRFSPYAVGGLGLFRFSSSEAKISGLGASTSVDGDSATRLGVNFGLGIDFE